MIMTISNGLANGLSSNYNLYRQIHLGGHTPWVEWKAYYVVDCGTLATTVDMGDNFAMIINCPLHKTFAPS
jgi:hypothetical protein